MASFLEAPASAVGINHARLYSGRPGTLSILDFADRLDAAWARARLKDKKLEAKEFLRQLPEYLDHEALYLWRQKKEDILNPPGDRVEGYDPILKVIELFKKEFGAASAEKVREIQHLKKREDETCRMLRSRLEQLSEDTGLFNNREKAIKFVHALPSKLRAKVEPVLWADSEGGVYTLDKALQVAERIEMAAAFSEGTHGNVQEEKEPATRQFAIMAKSAEDWVTRQGLPTSFEPKAQKRDNSCFRCGDKDHHSNECPHKLRQCKQCNKVGHSSAVCWIKYPEKRPTWTLSESARATPYANLIDHLAELVIAKMKGTSEQAARAKSEEQRRKELYAEYERRHFPKGCDAQNDDSDSD